MIWMLDSGPLDRLAQVASDSEWSWPGGLLHVSQMVVWEQRTSVRVAALINRTSSTGEPWITRHEFAVGSVAEHMYFNYLRPRRTHAAQDAGEDASIAICAHLLVTARFVVADGRAALWALIELGAKRVASEFDCWLWLHQNGHVDRARFCELCRRTQRMLSHDPNRRA